MNRAERRAKGLYWDRAWKLVEGCSKVSPGCDNCWSEAETAMRSHQTNEKISGRACLVIDPLTGKFDDIHLREDNLVLPLHTKKPTVFAIWNDLFHEDVSVEFIDRAYAVMALCPQHIFLVLTKRAERMAEYWSDEFRWAMIEGSAQAIEAKRSGCDPSLWLAVHDLPNVWHGTTAEDQKQYDLRITDLLRVPGRLYLSLEPLLGAIDLGLGWNYEILSRRLHAVLLGGESGKAARPMFPVWVRSLRDQCAAAGTPFFFKQWGEWLPECQASDHKKWARVSPTVEWPQHGEPSIFCARVGKRQSGRELDGVIHNNLPWDKPIEKAACRVCGCTDLDCSGCIATNGQPCHWVEPDMCSACTSVSLVQNTEGEGY